MHIQKGHPIAFSQTLQYPSKGSQNPTLSGHNMGTQTFTSSIADVVVASGGTTSRTVEARGEYADATAITIQAPATLAETCTIEVSSDGTTFVTLSDGTADIGPPAAGKGRQYIEMNGFAYWRIKAGSAAAADRTFKVWKQWSA
jgi:hypothetical protein